MFSNILYFLLVIASIYAADVKCQTIGRADYFLSRHKVSSLPLSMPAARAFTRRLSCTIRGWHYCMIDCRYFYDASLIRAAKRKIHARPRHVARRQAKTQCTIIAIDRIRCARRWPRAIIRDSGDIQDATRGNAAQHWQLLSRQLPRL